MKRAAIASLGALVTLTAAGAARAQFTYNPVGVLVSGSGSGRVGDEMIYVPGMRFPYESGPAYANSQVYGHGGYLGPGGGQCDAENYSYPWWDNYCEERTWSMPLCPSGDGHQGQDIRPGTCDKSTHWTVAADAGTITNVGSYSISLTRSDGTRFRYLHCDMGELAVSTGESVQRGDRIGLASNDFGGEATTIHLHFDIQQNVSGYGTVYVPTYTSLVDSYKVLLGAGGSGGTAGAGGSGNASGMAGAGNAAGAGGFGNESGTGGAGNEPGTGGAGNVPGAGGTGNVPGAGGASNAPGAGGFGNESGAGGSGVATGGSGALPPPTGTGCSYFPDCNTCDTCVASCLCHTNDWNACVAACDDPTPGAQGGATASPEGRPSSDGGCACSAPGDRRVGSVLGLALLAVPVLRRRRVVSSRG